MENKKQVFIVKNLESEIKKKIKLISVEQDISMADAIKLIVEEYYKNRK